MDVACLPDVCPRAPDLRPGGAAPQVSRDRGARKPEDVELLHWTRHRLLGLDLASARRGRSLRLSDRLRARAEPGDGQHLRHRTDLRILRDHADVTEQRAEARSVGKECVSTSRYRRSRYQYKKKKN